MSEHAPKTNSPIQEAGATLSSREYNEYGYKIRVPESNRHPQAQAEIEKVYGSADAEGRYVDAVIFPRETTSGNIYNSYVNTSKSSGIKDENRYMFENANLLPALRAGDIEREFHQSRLAAVEIQLADIAMGVKEGTRWQRFKKVFKGDDSKLAPIALEREKEFSEGRLEALLSEEQSQELAREFYERNKAYIHGQAIHEDSRREREATDRAFNEIVAADIEAQDKPQES